MSDVVKGYLITESYAQPVEPTLVEQNKKTGRITIESPLQDADVVNRNKRVYGKTVINNGLQSEYIRERLETKTWYGEAGK